MLGNKINLRIETARAGKTAKTKVQMRHLCCYKWPNNSDNDYNTCDTNEQ